MAVNDENPDAENPDAERLAGLPLMDGGQAGDELVRLAAEFGRLRVRDSRAQAMIGTDCPLEGDQAGERT